MEAAGRVLIEIHPARAGSACARATHPRTAIGRLSLRAAGFSVRRKRGVLGRQMFLTAGGATDLVSLRGAPQKFFESVSTIVARVLENRHTFRLAHRLLSGQRQARLMALGSPYQLFPRNKKNDVVPKLKQLRVGVFK